MTTTRCLPAVAAVLALFLFVPVHAQAADESPAALPAGTPATHVNHPALKKLGWQLACQSSTFDDMPLLDMIDRLHALGFHHIELSPSQTLSKDAGAVLVNENLTPAQIDSILAKLKSHKMDAISFGVIDLGNDPAKAQKVFDFAKKLKLKTIVIQPAPNAMDLLGQLADQYGINVAVFTPAPAANQAIDCQAILNATKDRSKRIGICADLSNLRRGKATPAECIKKFGDRLMDVHFNDIDAQGAEVPFGSGTVDAAAVVKQLEDQKFKGTCALEYSTGRGQDLLNHFVQSVNAFSDLLGKEGTGVQ